VRLEGEVEAGERLDHRQLGHLGRHFDAAVFADREYSKPSMASTRCRLRRVRCREDFQRARHLQGDEAGLDARADEERPTAA